MGIDSTRTIPLFIRLLGGIGREFAKFFLKKEGRRDKYSDEESENVCSFRRMIFLFVFFSRGCAVSVLPFELWAGLSWNLEKSYISDQFPKCGTVHCSRIASPKQRMQTDMSAFFTYFNYLSLLLIRIDARTIW